MRNYELTLVFSGDLKAEQLTLAQENIISFIQGKGGILLNQEIRGKRALLSPIKLRQTQLDPEETRRVKTQKEGNLAALKFTIDPSHIEELEKHLKEDQKILRFLCVVSVSRKVKQKTPRLAPQIASLPAIPKEQAFGSEAKARRGEGETKIIDLGDIDKKLEEIFKKP